MPDKIVTGRDLKMMRLKSGKTPTQITTRLNLKSHKTYLKWEKDSGGPDMNQWLVLVAFLGIDAARFIAAAMERGCKQDDICLDGMVTPVLSQK